MSKRRHDVWTWMRDHNIPVGGVASGIDKLIEHCIRLGQREAFAAGFERGVAHERGKYADEYDALAAVERRGMTPPSSPKVEALDERACPHGLHGECEPCDLIEQRDTLYRLLWEAVQALEWVEHNNFVEGISVVPCFVAQWAAQERQQAAIRSLSTPGEPDRLKEQHDDQ